VGLVERVEGLELVTIEGNTAVGNDSDGGCVMRRHRPWKAVSGYGRLREAPESATL
jgi:hypothetical protein